MDRLFLHSLNLKSVHLHIEDLAEVHDNRLVNFLPQVSSEDLNERDLKRRNLAMHKDASQVKLHLETNIDIRSVDCR